MSTTRRIILSGMTILLEKLWQNNLAVVVENNKIKAIIDEDMIEHHLPAEQYEFPKQYYLVPGFIDLHIHGAADHDVMDGSVKSLQKISHQLAKEGVTGFLATTMTASRERIEAALAVIPEAIATVQGAAILGVHLEGPFISREKMGAQNGDDVLLPDVDLFKRWQELSGDHIRIVTIAPELENALPFIQALRAMNVLPAIGHTNATYEQTLAAIAAGSTYATHLFNAMRQIHQREPGATGALLLANEVMAEMIADGKHLHAALYEIAYRIKGKERLLLVTDAMRAKCMGDGCYELGGQDVHVADGKATLANGTLAGSVLCMPDAIKNMMKFTDCSLQEAIRMASYNPAHKLNLTSRKGSIDVGKDADLVVLSDKLNVKLTMVGGEVVCGKVKAST